MYAQAISDCSKAIEIDPEYAPAYRRKALILATCIDAKYRDGIKAVELAKKVVELFPSPISLPTLAAAYAEAGEFHKAVVTQEKAINLLKEKGKSSKLIDAFLEQQKC